ncbi:MAG: ABC transporter ATP-binding protein [Deltaproteobacteria bacterium]|nr:ABC transporter ATP-binding protein [Deltaproteobacteria bacterium]
MKAADHYFELIGLHKNFGGLSAVRDLSFHIEQGKITSLIGPNGAGKTTVFNLISGQLPLDKGNILFKAKNITFLPPHKIVDLGIARTFQDLRLFQKLTVLQNVLMGLQNRKGEQILRALMGGKALTEEERADLQKAYDLLGLVELGPKSGELVENLSYGEQKLLSLARVLATDAELLMLDEPVSGLPLGEVDRMLKLIQDLVKQGKTILVVEHNMEAVMGISDWIIVLNFGEKIASGLPAEIQKNQEVIKVYLGV